MFKRLDAYFTDRRKGIAALGALGFALLWMFLWNAFPMEFYSLFFSKTSIIGSNIQLILLNIVTLLPLFWVFTKLTKTDLSFSATVLANIILLTAADYVFAIFAFADKFYLCVTVLIIHSIINILIFGIANVRAAKAPKGAKASASAKERAIKKQPLITVIWAAAFTFTAEAVSISLMYAIAHIYAY